MVLWPSIIQHYYVMPQAHLAIIKTTRTLNFAALRSSKDCTCINFTSSRNSNSCKENVIYFMLK